MNARTRELASLHDARRFLFFTSDDVSAQRLAATLRDDGVMVQEDAASERLSLRLAELNPQIVFLDFSVDEDRPGKLVQATELVRLLSRVAPGLPVVAVGHATRPEGAIAALRAGVRDFIDLANEGDVREVVLRVLHAQGSTSSTASGRGQMIVLLGVRAGVGTSTLSAHLATIAQIHMTQAGLAADPPRRRETDKVGNAVLLDLGWPVADGQLYLNVAGNFHFAEAVRNLRRFDETLVNTALTRSPSGVTVIPLPRDLAEMRTVSHSDSLALLDKLREHFGLLLADLGGFSNPEFVASLVRAADQTWLVTDQSVGALVSLADVLRDLDGRDVDRSRLRLIVNRHDERYGMTAEQIATRFGIELQATLPDRTLALMSSTNQGKLLHEVSDRDPYVRVLHTLADSLSLGQAKSASNKWLSRWLPGVQKHLV
jgi:pilus assembly protein CpaE